MFVLDREPGKLEGDWHKAPERGQNLQNEFQKILVSSDKQHNMKAAGGHKHSRKEGMTTGRT